jgi:probable rRNA maturation factor
MTVFLDIPDEYTSLIDSLSLRKNIQLLLIDLDIPEVTEFSVAFVSDERIRELNQDFRGIDAPTDVLSFPSDEINPEDGTTYIGDIIISMDTVQKQSDSAHISQIDEIHLLIIHGLLHLVGYDHDTEENKQDMWDIQSKLLQLLHCPANPDQYEL